MPLYFFNVADEASRRPLPPDPEGTDMAGPDAARAAAVVLAGEVIRELDGAFWESGDWQMYVTDEAGALVCTLRFSGTSGETAG